MAPRPGETPTLHTERYGLTPNDTGAAVEPETTASSGARTRLYALRHPSSSGNRRLGPAGSELHRHATTPQPRGVRQRRAPARNFSKSPRGRRAEAEPPGEARARHWLRSRRWRAALTAGGARGMSGLIVLGQRPVGCAPGSGSSRDSLESVFRSFVPWTDPQGSPEPTKQRGVRGAAG